MKALYHIYEVSTGKPHKITHSPITLDKVKQLCGGSIIKLESSGYRLVKAMPIGKVIITRRNYHA